MLCKETLTTRIRYIDIVYIYDMSTHAHTHTQPFIYISKYIHIAKLYTNGICTHRMKCVALGSCIHQAYNKPITNSNGAIYKFNNKETTIVLFFILFSSSTVFVSKQIDFVEPRENTFNQNHKRS